MRRAKTRFGIPIAIAFAVIRRAGISDARVVVDRDERVRVTIAVIARGPTAVVVPRAHRANLAEKDRRR